MSNTNMAHAMQKAGVNLADYKTPYEESIAIATEAWTKWSTPAGAGARRDFLRQRITLPMLWDIIDHWSRNASDGALRFVLEDAAQRIKDEAREKTIKPKRAEFRNANALNYSNSEFRKKELEREQKREIEKQIQWTMDEAIYNIGNHDRLIPEIYVQREINWQAKKAGWEVEQRVNSEALTRLHGFSINGVSLYNMTARDALAWCDQQENNVEFVRSLCSGVPLHATLGEYYGSPKGEIDVEAFWQVANSEENKKKRQEMRAAALDHIKSAKNLADSINDHYFVETKMNEVISARALHMPDDIQKKYPISDLGVDEPSADWLKDKWQ